MVGPVLSIKPGAIPSPELFLIKKVGQSLFVVVIGL